MPLYFTALQNVSPRHSRAVRAARSHQRLAAAEPAVKLKGFGLLGVSGLGLQGFRGFGV